MRDFLPPVELLLEMQPEMVAPYLLIYLNEYSKTNPNGFPIGNVLNHEVIVQTQYANYPEAERVSYVLSEAWGWLLAQGFLAPAPLHNSNNVFVTRRGQNVKSAADIKKFAHISLLPRAVLDSELDKKVWPSFIDGDFDTAIFAAFKEVEVRMRNTAGLDSTHLGVTLAREVFNPENGQLTDKTTPDKGERVGYMELFAGAIGVFKNPGSHRPVNYDDPTTVVSLILFANTLLQIIEKRKPLAERELSQPIRKNIF